MLIIDKNAKRLINHLKELGLSSSDFMICGSLALNLRGLLNRYATDVDILVKGEAFDRLADGRAVMTSSYTSALKRINIGCQNNRPLMDIKEEPERYKDLAGTPGFLKGRFDRADLCDGLLLSSTHDILAMKSLRGSPKDIDDLHEVKSKLALSLH